MAESPRRSAPRILYVVLSLNPGGTERLVLELATRLHPEMATAVCCLDEPGAWAGNLEARGIEVRALGRAPGFRPGLGRSIAGIARRHRATVIHAHHYTPFVYSCVARLWRPGLPVVFTEHGRLSDAQPSGRRRAANRLLTRFPRRAFAVSEDLKQHLVGEGFAAHQVDVIYNGIDVGPTPDGAARERARRMIGVSDETFVIGTIARLDSVKDLDTLLRAAATVASSRSTTLVIIGDGPERERLERAAGEFGIASHVQFLGHRDDARAVLAGCDVYANTSISEGISLTILEAMAASLPIVATRVGGTPEVIDATCGRLVAARDVAAVATALADLARAPSTRHDLGHAARQRVEQRFTLERMVREYRDVYASVAGAV